MAAALCVLLGAAMVLNVGGAGEATWFWYATLMHHGLRLYADMHLALQPFYVLETDAWMLLVGHHTLADQMLAVLHVGLLTGAMWLVMRGAPARSWCKACLLVAAFVTDIFFVAIRFDDFHVVNDICVLGCLIVLLQLAHEERARLQTLWSAAAGLLLGVAFTNRASDGAALLLAVAWCVPFLAKHRKALNLLVCGAAMTAAVLLVVRLTGDTYAAWLSNSIFHAAAAKGGSGTVLRGPWVAEFDTLRLVRHYAAGLLMLAAGLLVGGWLVRRFLSDTTPAILAFDLLCIAAAFLIRRRGVTWENGLIIRLNPIFQVVVYPACLWVFYRFWRSRRPGSTRAPTSPLEMLIALPAAELISGALSQATGTSNNTMSMVLLLLFSSYWVVRRPDRRWLHDTWMAVVIAIALSGFALKIVQPYAWNAYVYDPLFEHRQWYSHPVYGPMYAETDLLHFMVPVCAELHASGPHPQLLSLPYSYPNYFCDTPPWHGYVQTWFDTITPANVEVLMQQLQTAPPQWILYERQLKVLAAHETEYTHGKPLAHRLLDDLLMRKLASGEWKLVDRRDYLVGDGWYLIETHPSPVGATP